MQWALVRIVEEHLFVTKTEHEKKSLCISQKKKKVMEVLFFVPYSCRPVNRSYVCESLIEETRKEVSGLALQF